LSVALNMRVLIRQLEAAITGKTDLRFDAKALGTVNVLVTPPDKRDIGADVSYEVLTIWDRNAGEEDADYVLRVPDDLRIAQDKRLSFVRRRDAMMRLRDFFRAMESRGLIQYRSGMI